MVTRTSRMIGLSAAALLSSVAVSFAADATAVKKYALPQRGSLQMNVPVGWSDEVRPPQQSNMPPTIVFRARDGKAFDVLVTPIWRARPEVPVATKEALRQSVQKAADELKAQALEQTIPIIELTGASGPGFYFSVTDKAPNPGEYKYLTQGLLRVGELAVSFSILTNDGQEQVREDALTLLKSAVHLQP
jgi:hypothetical protein